MAEEVRGGGRVLCPKCHKFFSVKKSTKCCPHCRARLTATAERRKEAIGTNPRKK